MGKIRGPNVVDWFAFQLVTLTPHRIMPGYGGGWRDRLFIALLPYAGAWAFRPDFPTGEPEQ